MGAVVLVTLIVPHARTLMMCNVPSWIKVGYFCTPVPVVPRVRVSTQMKPSFVAMQNECGFRKVQGEHKNTP
jgi:hypothetical protein